MEGNGWWNAHWSNEMIMRAMRQGRLKSGKMFGWIAILKDRAASALVLAGLDLEGNTGSFREGLVDAPVFHSRAF